jgi:hypothetical protein
MDEKMRIDHAGHVTTKPWPTQFDNDPSKWFELTGKIPKREWVGFTAAERDEIVPMLVQSLINHDDKTMTVLLRAILIDVEEQLKEKNGYGSEVYGPPTDFIGPSVVKAISKREWVGLTAKDLAEIPSSCYEGAIWADAKLREKNHG